MTDGQKNRINHRLPVIRVVCFVLVGILLFFCVQGVLTLKWEYAIRMPYDELKAAVPAQVLFVGTSHIYSNISPMAIYEEFGITSMDLSSPAQPIQLSYDLLEEALDRWTPELVMLEAGELFTTPKTELDKNYWELLMANMPLSAFKVKDAQTFAETTARLKENTSFQSQLMGALLPIYRFHNRWSELSAVDFTGLDQDMQETFAKGFWMMPLVSPGIDTIQSMNDVAAAIAQEMDAVATYIDGGVTTEADLQDIPIYSPQLDEYNIQCFEKIEQLCQEKGVPLQLVKTPCVANPVSSSSAWTWQKHELVEQYAQSQGIPFFDVLYDADAGIDWTQDTFDGGWHLNVRGAKKASTCLGQYLRDTCGLEPVEDPSYDEALPVYKQAEALAMEQTEPDLSAWVDWIQNSDRDLTVAMAVCEDMSLGLTEENIKTLQSIGLQTDFSAMSFGDTFLAVWEHSADGTDAIPYEAASNRELTYAYRAPGEGTLISLLSRGGYQYANVSIKVDDLEQTWVIRGLHFMVYDNASGVVLDDMWVDFSAGGTVTHANSLSYHADFVRWLNKTADTE